MVLKTVDFLARFFASLAACSTSSLLCACSASSLSSMAEFLSTGDLEEVCARALAREKG